MPFSSNKDIHWVFSDNLKNRYTVDNLRAIKKSIIDGLKIQEEEAVKIGTKVLSPGRYILDEPEPGVRMIDNLGDRSLFLYSAWQLQLVSEEGETPALQDVYKNTKTGKLYEQAKSKNNLVSAFKDILTDTKLYLQTTDVKAKALELKAKATEKVKNVLTKAQAAIVMSDVYTAALMGFSAAMMNTVGFGGEGNNNIPEAIIGSVPLYSVQSMERSRSDRIVKYRAIGDVFLAHQRGTKDSLRIDGTLFGPFRHIYIIMLLAFQQRGEQRLETIKSITSTTQAATSLSEDIALGGDKNKVPVYEKHETFPIITQTSILLDMFLQTIEWHESVEDGVKCIKYHLLFRKYIEPKGWEAMSGDKASIKKFNIDYASDITERRRKELLYDMIWKLKRAGGEMYMGAWTGGKSRDDWIKETTSYAPFLYLFRPATLTHIIRDEMIGSDII